MKKHVAIVLPSHNEEGNISLIYDKVMDVWAENLAGSYEVSFVFVDDGSRDGTWQDIAALAKEHAFVKGIRLSRNFGHQAALEAGLVAVDGKCDAVIMMDCDLQHPPELLPTLIARWEEGYSIVNTKRKDDSSVSFFKRMTSRFFYTVLNAVTTIRMHEGASDFRLIDRKVLAVFQQLPEKPKFFRGLIQWVGFRVATVPFAIGKRQHGVSSYTLGKMMSLANLGITSFSRLPMKIIFLFGTSVFVVSSILFALILIVKYALDSTVFSGSAVLASFILMNNGLLIMIVGVVALYQMSMFSQIQNRPSYLVEDRINF